MLKKTDLEALHPTTLAVLCTKLADVSDEPTAARCRELKTEWVQLQNPPSMSLKEEREKDARRWDLRTRMIDFLDGHDEVDFFPKR